MKRINLGLAVLALTFVAPLSAVFAADLAYKAPCCSQAPAWSWSGFYGGVNLGGSWGYANDTVAFTPPGGASVPIATDITHPSGVIGGAQAGFNWSGGPLVFGIETDIQAAAQSNTATAVGVITTCGVPCSVTETDKVTWFGTTRGRVGFAAGNWMPYVTGGVAYGGINTSGTENFTGFPSLALTSATTTRAGWTAGGGVEGHLAGQWTWKVEYLYLDFGRTNFAFAEPAGFAPGTVTQSLRVTDNVARFGVNWYFGGPAPVACCVTK